MISLAVFLSSGLAAQSASEPAEKDVVAKSGQKTGKAEPIEEIAMTAKSDEVITLTDNRNYKAKSAFEQMLLRRLEIDAELGEKERRQQINKRPSPQLADVFFKQ